MVSNVANKNLEKAYPRKYFLFSKMSWRRLQSNNFSSFKTSSRRACKTSFKDVFKTSSRCICKTSSSRRLQDVFKRTSCNYILKTFSRRLQNVLKDKKMLHWRRLQDVFSMPSSRRMFAGIWWFLWKVDLVYELNLEIFCEINSCEKC